MRIPIETLHLFPELDEKLLALLKGLTPDEWNRPTRAGHWTVKDVAGHLLDGNLRTLSLSRDHYFGESNDNIHSYQDLVGFLNRLNADWVKATKRLSPIVLLDLLEVTGKEYYEHLKSLDPFGTAIFPVAWAGEEHSENWFHIAREYTEKWHHQQQIREAVGKPGITERRLYFPVLQTFIRAVPHHYKNVKADEGCVIHITITGDAGGEWFVKHAHNQWMFVNPINADTEICMTDNTAWKLFTKGLSRTEAEHLVAIRGNKEAGKPVLSMLSVMA